MIIDDNDTQKRKNHRLKIIRGPKIFEELEEKEVKKKKVKKIKILRAPKVEKLPKETFITRIIPRSVIRAALFTLFFLLFFFALINLIRWKVYNSKTEGIINNLVKENIINEKVISTNGNSNPYNFEALKEKNPDTVGWIKISGTTIDYPIVQSEDNEYYLYKDFNKEYSTCGWIFMDKSNNSDLIDYNTIIYGHNLKSGLMFKDLTKIYNRSLGNEIFIEIYNKNYKNTYKVFSSYKEEPNDYSIKANISNEADQTKYINAMLSKSSTTYNVFPASSDKLLTLSTCDSSGKKRILVHAVLIKSEKYN